MELDHVKVSARDRRAAARRLAAILDVPWGDARFGPFTAVYVSDGLTLDFDETASPPVEHFAFRLGDAEFDALVARLRSLGVAYRSSPHGDADGEVGAFGGGRIVYWAKPDGHVWEALTASYARRTEPPATA